MVEERTHDVRVFGYPSVMVICMICKNVDQDPIELYRFERGYAPTMLDLNTVALNHYQETMELPDGIKLEPRPMPERTVTIHVTTGVPSTSDDDEGLNLG